jgi:hypothetical protein
MTNARSTSQSGRGSPGRLTRYRCSGDTGATLSEYALGFSVVAVVALISGSYLTSASEEEAQNQADCVSMRPPPTTCLREPVPAPPTSPGPTGSVTSSTATPPPTDPPPTTPPPPQGDFTPGTATLTRDNVAGTWTISWPFTVVDQGNTPVADAEIRGVVTIGPQSYSISCLTDAGGACALAFADIPVADASVDIRVISINSVPAVPGPYPTGTFTVPA